MARDFYPFVEEQGKEGADKAPKGLDFAQSSTRIAVYDDPSAAPRVVIIDPQDTRAYLEEITKEVNRLAHEQGGRIPFMVIREVVENLIHAYFMDPSISILDGGNTIRFADQGPGIKEKDRALEYGTTSATEEMRKYIRGVGSGLPYAQQYLEDHGGSLVIDDNIHNGTIVTISMVEEPAQAPEAPAAPQPMGAYMPAQPYGAPQAFAQPTQGAWAYPPQPQQPQYAPQGYPQPYAQPYPQQTYQQPAYPQMPQQAPHGAIQLSERGQRIIAYLSQHESVGPKDLVDAYGLSQPTWTRELQALEQEGIIAKRGGQKRFLTAAGRMLLG